jgi:hypothetical protein
VRLAIVVQKSQNEKIGRVSTTYAPTRFCVDCRLKDCGCYAQHGMVALHVRPLDRAARRASAIDAARQEAAGIDALQARSQALRLHTSGDCPTPMTARIVAAAVRRFTKRGGGPAWTYTHAWRRVTRAAWRGVSVLASCDSVSDVAEARSRGYAPAFVVPQFWGDKAHYDDATDTTWIPCPAQTRENVTCESCRLCWHADELHASRRGIAFEAHGSARRKAAQALAR